MSSLSQRTRLRQAASAEELMRGPCVLVLQDHAKSDITAHFILDPCGKQRYASSVPENLY